MKQVLTNQHRFILSLMEHVDTGEIWGRTRFQKIVFLLQNKVFEDNIFFFYPHHYGPFSKGLIVALEDLQSLHLVDITDNEDGMKIKFTEIGKRFYSAIQSDDEFGEKMSAEANSYSYRKYNELLEEVYHDFPLYAKNSRVKDIYLPDEQTDKNDSSDPVSIHNVDDISHL